MSRKQRRGDTQAKGQSMVEFSFSDGFLKQLAKEGRIAIQLASEGFIPVGLVVEK